MNHRWIDGERATLGDLPALNWIGANQRDGSSFVMHQARMRTDSHAATYVGASFGNRRLAGYLKGLLVLPQQVQPVENCFAEWRSCITLH